MIKYLNIDSKMANSKVDKKWQTIIKIDDRLFNVKLNQNAKKKGRNSIAIFESLLSVKCQQNIKIHIYFKAWVSLLCQK